MHSRQRATVEHTLVTMHELQSPASKGRRNSCRRELSKEKCPVHSDQQLDLFCTTCCIATCSKCALLNHPPPAHALMGASEAADRATTSIREIAGRCAEALAKHTEGRERIRRLRRRLQSDADESILLIQTKALEATESVLQRKDTEESILDAREEEVTHAITTMEDLIRFSAAAVETPSRLKFIEIEASLVARLEQKLAVPEHQIEASELLHESLPHAQTLRIQSAESDLKRIADLFRPSCNREETACIGCDAQVAGARSGSEASVETRACATQACDSKRRDEACRLSGGACRQALDQAEIEMAHMCREEMEAAMAAMREAADEQTDMIVSLESDLRRALEARDSLEQRLLGQRESAAVPEIERIACLEAECTRLRNALDPEVASQKDAARRETEESVLGAGLLDAEAEAQLHLIAEELEVAAAEWRTKYCALRMKAELLVAKVAAFAKLVCDEVEACREMADIILELWRQSIPHPHGEGALTVAAVALCTSSRADGAEEWDGESR